jgi:hypothetical protein
MGATWFENSHYTKDIRGTHDDTNCQSISRSVICLRRILTFSTKLESQM